MIEILRNKQKQTKNRAPMVLFLQESIKLTIVLYVVVILLAMTKWLTSGKANLVSIEYAFELTKTWGFVLLLLERFLRITALLIKSIAKSIAGIIETTKKLIEKTMKTKKNDAT